MKVLFKVGLAALTCVAIAWGAIQFLLGPSSGHGVRRTVALGSVPEPGASTRIPEPAFPPIPLFGDEFIDDSGYGLAYNWTAPIADRASLAECLEACRGRSRRGIAAIKADLDRRLVRGGSSPIEAIEASKLLTQIAALYMYDGSFEEADGWIARAFEMAGTPGVPPDLQANMIAFRGVNALRRGETENCINCLGPSSCIFPIAPEAVHQRPEGSRAAVGYFTEYLRRRPQDLCVRWLLNVASMTLGEYPDRVPQRFLIPPDRFRSKSDIGRFTNVATLVGLDSRGPNMSGGSLFDDFTGDGLPDLLTTTIDWDGGGSFFVNRGDGSFEDRSESSGLAAQPMALNAAHADFDNDGRSDVVILRGGWENSYPLSLLRNLGDGRFQDVTVAAGLGEPIAAPSAAWGDFDNDGRLDLFVCGEYSAELDEISGSIDPGRSGAIPANFCRLYRNNGDGTFTDVARRAGVLNERWAKGAAWGDFDDDGHPDLYVSNFASPNRLYRNNGDGTFTDVAPRLGVDGPRYSFACWFWDFDNDGRLDLYVNGYRASMNEIVGHAQGRPAQGAERPRLYRNLGPEGFRDITAEAGLDRVLVPMGSNFADVDNDGFLDVYLGTGRPPYSYLVPNVMLRNVDGTRFEDVTESTGTGHLQKGHGVSFADWDRDGDLDLFIQVGGATPGDRANNVLFQNPGQGHHWLQARLIGTRSNRSALGARVRVDIPAGPTGPARSIHRSVGGNSSFGGNSLAVSIGLGDSARPVALTVTWPTGGLVQTFEIAADRAVEITEGVAEPRILDSTPIPSPGRP
ncbi:CRTAC1 family protein [Tundrisphaera lichenicola]|uniref:CRTAC1 family protein n=1 Tax=Tundrisphaera lichenicola TaxID=2029860 RepID=UPI003EBBB1FB